MDFNQDASRHPRSTSKKKPRHHHSHPHRSSGDAQDANENRRRKSWTSFTDPTTTQNESQEDVMAAARQKRCSYPGLDCTTRSSSPVLGAARVTKNRIHVITPSTSPVRAYLQEAKRQPARRQQQRSRERDIRDEQSTTTTTTDNESDEGGNTSSSTDDVCRQRPGPCDSLLMTNLSDMWRRHRLCDVILRSNGQEVAAHKLALAAFSEPFARRYCEGDKRSVQVRLFFCVTNQSNIMYSA
jgi:hypothetical protein